MIDYILASCLFADSFSSRCTLEDPGFSSDHVALVLGFTPRTPPAAEPPGSEAPASQITNFHLGKAVWGRSVVKTWVLDVLPTLLTSAPLASAPALLGLLYLAAAIFQSFRISSTMMPVSRPEGPTYARLYRDVAAVAARCPCLKSCCILLPTSQWKYNI